MRFSRARPCHADTHRCCMSTDTFARTSGGISSANTVGNAPCLDSAMRVPPWYHCHGPTCVLPCKPRSSHVARFGGRRHLCNAFFLATSVVLFFLWRRRPWRKTRPLQPHHQQRRQRNKRHRRHRPRPRRTYPLFSGYPNAHRAKKVGQHDPSIVCRPCQPSVDRITNLCFKVVGGWG